MRKTLIIIIAALSVFQVSILYAKDGLNASAGFKIFFAKDENVLQNYYKPFAGIGWTDEFFEVNAAYYRFISYSVTDELLNTKKIGINQPELEVTVYPVDILSLNLAYSFFTGDSSYMAHRISGGLMLDFESSDLSFDYSYKTCEYDFGITIENESQNAAVEFSMDITDSVSWDIAYDFERTDYITYGYIYNKHTLRAGLLYLVSAGCFLMGGLSGSVDTGDVIGAMVDAGITIKLYDHIKLGAIYMFTAEFFQSSSGGGSHFGSKTTSSSINTTMSHTGSISVSLYL